MLKKEDVYFRCLERWNANDEKTAYFKQHYDEWFSQLPEEIHEVVLQLLEMFMYYSQERVNSIYLNFTRNWREKLSQKIRSIHHFYPKKVSLIVLSITYARTDKCTESVSIGLPLI